VPTVQRLTERAEWRVFSVLPRASRPLAFAWWALLLGQGILPAGLAVAIRALV